MTIKKFKLWLYKDLAHFPGVYLLSFLIVTAALIRIIWKEGVPLRSGTDLWANIVIFDFAAIWLVLFLTGIFIWAWYFVWFRYLAYGAARIISLFRRLFKNTFFQFIIILAISAGFWVWRKSLFPGKGYKPREMLILSQAIKVLVITAIVFTIWQIYKSRKRIFISDFKNYTGDKELKPAVKGVAARILNEANRLSKLIKTIDEIQPESKKDVIAPTLDVQDMGKTFVEIFGQESTVGIGKVNIPLRPIYVFFNKLVHGPTLGGGIHLKGEKLVVTACLKGGKFSGSWEISIDDIEKPLTSKSEQLIAITDQLVCRIIAHISQVGSPRWKAMRHYSEALRLYRETLRTIEKRKLNLIKAKNECSRALRDDSIFVQCYYNLGIIYNELESNDAARAAFRKALESAPDNYHCYYELARLYYKEKNYFDARWFCEQALTICPTDANHWNLWAVIKSKEVYNVGEDDYKKPVDIPDDVVQYFTNASALAWRALCESIINGEKIQQVKETARICIRNLAVITGMRKQWRSRCLFKQAIFLDPDNNDLHFESGKYYYRKNKIKKAYEAFKRVFEDDKEVDDSFSYWAFYINVNARLCRKTKNKKKKKEYKEVVENGFFHFLDASAKLIHNNKIQPDDYKEIYRIYRIEKLVSDAFSFEESEIGFILELISILNNDITSINDWEDKTRREIINYLYEWPKVFRQYSPELSEDFLRWVAAQAAIKSAILIIGRRNRDDSPEVIYRLNFAEEILKEKNPNEFKILGLYRYLGEAFFLLDLREKALEQAREAVRLDPYNWEIRKLLGEIYFALNDYQKAINEFEISARLDELPPAELIEILKKIGKAYAEKGKILRDPKEIKNSFNKAIEFFTDALEILEDKSYEKKDKKEDSQYIQCLAEIHFYLGAFHRELFNYNDAMIHSNIAREMGYENIGTPGENRMDPFGRW